MKVLIVEDDASLQSFYHQVLSYHNLDVYIAVDGQQAITQLQKICPTLIILDMRLPYIDGTHILDFIAQDKNLSKALVVIVSALQDYEQEVNRVPNAIFLLKPVLPNQLNEVVKVVMEHGEITCD
jgi:DNA-binding response OmpR family regulator